MAEDWQWQFEQSFLEPFLRSNVILIDRATILRLTAADAGVDAANSKIPSVKAIETKALRDKADLFMEILVRRNPVSPIGYEFRAAVKEVETGRWLALVSSLSWKQARMQRLRATTYVATPTGYEPVRPGGFPELDRVAGLLAGDVMASLADLWSRE